MGILKALRGLAFKKSILLCLIQCFPDWWSCWGLFVLPWNHFSTQESSLFHFEIGRITFVLFEFFTDSISRWTVKGAIM